ncbi:MAG: peroxiredoxin family protein [Terriglobia bacterium]
METAASAATIFVAALLSAVLIKAYLIPTPAQARLAVPVPDVTAGVSLKTSLAGVDWRRNGRTLVLAVSTQCHFCTDSAPFFRTLVARSGKGVKTVAVLPQSVAEAQRYLSREDVSVNQIKQVVLTSIGVRGTPTVLLVNRFGVVTNVWVGELQPSGQRQVLAVLTGATAEGQPPSTVGALAVRP